jgi:hypothetical protein
MFKMRTNALITAGIVMSAISATAGAAVTSIDNFGAGAFSVSGPSGSIFADSQDASILALAGSNNRRRVSRIDSNFNGASYSHAISSAANGSAIDSGSLTWGAAGQFSGGSVTTQIDYGNNQLYSGTNVNISTYSGFRVEGSGTFAESTTTDALRSAYVQLSIYDITGKTAAGSINLTAGALGNFDFAFSSLTVTSGFNWSSVARISFFMSIGGGNFNTSGTRSFDYTYTNMQLIPAPGALALLGAAGLVGARRRRA